MIQTVFFDLDGTLLPMVQEEFVKGYFGLLCKQFAPRGYAPEKMVSTLWEGVRAMVENDGSCLNRDRFWQAFARAFGRERLADIPLFDKFYETEFNLAKETTQPTPLAREIVRSLRDNGFSVVLATNPIFPLQATRSRIQWAGLKVSDFDYVTTYDNSTFCKPNPAYYQEICEKLSLNPTNCLMVGNDEKEDLAAARIGMETYLVTDCRIACSGAPAPTFGSGTLAELQEQLSTMTPFAE